MFCYNEGVKLTNILDISGSNSPGLYMNINIRNMSDFRVESCVFCREQMTSSVLPKTGTFVVKLLKGWVNTCWGLQATPLSLN